MDKKLLEMLNDAQQGEDDCSVIVALCDKARSCFVDALIWHGGDRFIDVVRNYGVDFMCKPNLTAIEQIFLVAYYVYFSVCEDEISVDLPIPTWLAFVEEIVPQPTVKRADKVMRPDFIVDFTRLTTSGDHIYPSIRTLKYAVELDGHDYHHAQKSQVAHDYERENALKEMGFSVIRFTGSQVYHTPYTCIDQLFKIVKADAERCGHAQ